MKASLVFRPQLKARPKSDIARYLPVFSAMGPVSQLLQYLRKLETVTFEIC